MEIASDTTVVRTENLHYSFNHSHRHLWHCAWVWILIISLLTPQFSYEVEAGIFKRILKEVGRAAEKVEEKVIRPVAQAVVPKSIRDQADRLLNEVDRAGHKVEKYMIRPLNDPKVIGKVFTVGVAASLTGGILVPALLAGTTSVAYDRVVFNVHNGGDLTKSFLTAAGSATVTAAFNKYIPVEKEVIDPVTGVKTKELLLSPAQQYARGIAMSVSHIAVGQATSLIVDGKGTLGGRTWSGALAGAFVPSVQLVSDNNLVATLVDPINRSVVEQSVVNRFNMKKVDIGAAVTSGAMAWRDSLVTQAGTAVGGMIRNWWYESEQRTSSAKRGISSADEIPSSSAEGEINADEDGMGDNPAISNEGTEGSIEDLFNGNLLITKKFLAEMRCKGATKYKLVYRPFDGLLPSDSIMNDIINALFQGQLNSTKSDLAHLLDVLGNSPDWSKTHDENQKPWHGHIIALNDNDEYLGNIGFAGEEVFKPLLDSIDRNLKEAEPKNRKLLRQQLLPSEPGQRAAMAGGMVGENVKTIKKGIKEAYNVGLLEGPAIVFQDSHDRVKYYKPRLDSNGKPIVIEAKYYEPALIEVVKEMKIWNLAYSNCQHLPYKAAIKANSMKAAEMKMKAAKMEKLQRNLNSTPVSK